jgi:hypothetical protein
MFSRLLIVLMLVAAFGRTSGTAAERKTVVSIRGEAFHLNGKPTYQGREFRGMKIEGLLLNSRMVQGIFDDLNRETRSRWDYPDGPWDPDRNTREFIAAMPAWRKHGLLSFTICLQGGSPEGYSKNQPWLNSAFDPKGGLRTDYMTRLERILDVADELGMSPMVSYFYFGQSGRLDGEEAVRKATENATDWLIEKGYRNVLVEIANEVNIGGHPPAIKPPRSHELIELVKARSAGKVQNPAKRLLVSTSFGGGAIPSGNVVQASDFILLHGNGVKEPERIRAMVDQVRALASYRGQPIVFNEDDHFDFDKPDNNFVAALSKYAGWGYFDFRMKDESYPDGFQSVPVDWSINSPRKRAFFELLRQVTGGE